VLAGEPGRLPAGRGFIEAPPGSRPPPSRAILAGPHRPAAGMAPKRLLQSAAVVGTDVPLVLLQDGSRTRGDAEPAGQARGAAGRRVSSTSRRLFPDFEYTFRHVLTHDVAYGSLSQARRRAACNARIAARGSERLRPKRLIEDRRPARAPHLPGERCGDRAVR